MNEDTEEEPMKKRNMYNEDIEEESRKKRRFGDKNLTYKLKCLDKCKCKRERVKFKNGKYDSKQLDKNKKCEIKCNKKCNINYMRKTQKKKYKQKGGIEPIYKYMKKDYYDYDKIKELLEMGADPNIVVPGTRGQNPLMISMHYEDHKLFDLLMEYDVDPLLEDESENSTLDYIQIALDGLFAPHSNIYKNAEYFMDKVIEKLKKKEEASKIFQKNYRGLKTRRKKYIDRYRSYKPWKGTEAMDYYLHSDEDIFNYLREDDENFVLKLPSTREERYEAWNINDILRSLKIPNRDNAYLIFYECLTREQTLRPENVSRSDMYFKIGAAQFIVKLPHWFYLYIMYGNKIELPEPRIYTLKKYKMIYGLVSNDIYDYGGNAISGDHCNYPKPVWAYELVIDKEEDYITDFIKYVDNVDIDRSNLHLNPYSTIYEWFYKHGVEEYLKYESDFSYNPITMTLSELYNRELIDDYNTLIEEAYIPEDIAEDMYQEYINIIYNYDDAFKEGYTDGTLNIPIDYGNYNHQHYEDGYYLGQKEYLKKMKETSDWHGLESLHNQLGGIGSADTTEQNVINYDDYDLLKGDEDAFKNYLEFLAKENGRYTMESCKRLKNLTDSKKRLLFDPLVKSHIKPCAKFNVISNFFNKVHAENIVKDEQYLFAYIRDIINFNMKEANEEGIDTINNHSISDIILSSGYYEDFSLEERRELWFSIRHFIINNNLHIEKYSKILLSLLSTYDTQGENQFRIRVMNLLRFIAERLRSINTSEETIDKMIIKFIQSFNWDKIIRYT